ncbi:hypothetical protein V6N11_019351 [Hibiscus sabdariffa]|uniref:Uncharacterized protein n=1 Tax=Hibiscus sabdariffa TaxID=183260 RepID=A0ABR2R255_9ROSI
MPSMSEVVLMLSSDVPLQQPKQPGFFTERDLVEASADNQKPNWSNDFAITVAWRLFCDENFMELVAGQIKETCNRFEVPRLIHVGLSRVQRNLEDMPSMSEVVLMLSSDVPLQQPKQPGSFTKRDLVEASADNQKPNWSNDFAITVIQAR